MKGSLNITSLNSLADALAVAAIRNDCRAWLTNHSGYISPLAQARWWKRNYSAPGNKNYRVWLARDATGVPCAYAALAYEPAGALLTVCVAPTFRQQGLGGAMLRFLAAQSLPPGVAPKLIAVIRADNANSLALHTKLGYAACGEESPGLLRYELNLTEPCR
jgi:RimJ/RimL family protein N-acetyltransferase